MGEDITVVMTNLVFQLAIVIFAVRVFGILAKKVNIPTVLGELVAGIVIGPYALGKVPFPGFAHGIFPLNSASLAVSPELYAFSTIASIILLFSSGIETDLKMFLKYSVSGGIIGFGGVAASFILGDFCAVVLLHVSFGSTTALFFGIMSTATSVGITARILSDKKKMDSPEGVTILAAAVFDDVLGIVLLAVVMGIVSALSGGESLSGAKIGLIALKAFAIWLFFTVICILFSKKIANFVKLFGGTFDFTICALGVAFFLAGIFEKSGLALIIGAYTTGLALSGTDIAPMVQERIHGIYKFFVPIFFAEMGMCVDLGQLFSKQVLIIGGIYTLLAILAKVIGCGGPSLFLGFNGKGALRIGAGMVPRGEVALIIAGIGLTSKIIDQKLFGVVILMTLVTTLVSPPLLNVFLGIKGRGTKKEVKTSETKTFQWDFKSESIAGVIMDLFLKNLRGEGFYVQTMDLYDGISQARRGNVALSINQTGPILSVQAESADMGFVQAEIQEIVLELGKSLDTIKVLKNMDELHFSFFAQENRIETSFFKDITPQSITCHLHGTTKEEIISEMVDLLDKTGAVKDKKKLKNDILEREQNMSTGFERGIAIPHAKTDSVNRLCIAVGIKEAGINFDSIDGKPSYIFVMMASPRDGGFPLLQTMAAISSELKESEIDKKVLTAKTGVEIADILKYSEKKQSNPIYSVFH